MSAFLDLHNFMAGKLAWQEAIIKDQALSPVARLIACQMMHDLHSERRGAWRSQDAMAALIGVDKRTVRRALAALVAAGYLKTTVSKGRGHANFYEALFDRLNMAQETHAEATTLAPEKGTPVSAINEEKRAPVSGKEDTGAPPYLEINLITPLTPLGSDAGQKPVDTAEAIEAHWSAFEAAFPANHATSAGWRRARLAFEGIVTAGQASPETLIAAAASYAKARAGQSPDRTKFPQHWLREDRWRSCQPLHRKQTQYRNARKPTKAAAPAYVQPLPFEEPSIRNASVRCIGEARTISYLDGASRWRELDRTIVIKSDWQAERLRSEWPRVLLKDLDIRIVADAKEYSRLTDEMLSRRTH